MEALNQFLEVCFTGANAPASVVLLAAVMYWLFVIVVGLDLLDAFDFDLDMDAEPDLGSTVSLGMVTLRFLNIGRVPFMIWMGAFAISYWSVSIAFDRLLDSPEKREVLFYAIQFGVRNLAVSLLVTKAVTHPLRGKFDPVEPNTVRDLIGKECIVTTSEVNREFGQVRYEANGAPLLLHARTETPGVRKGDIVVLVSYDSENNFYHIQKPEPKE